MECHRALTCLLRVASLTRPWTSLYLVALSENRVVSNQSMADPRGPFLSVDSLERNMQKGLSQSLLPMTMAGQPDLHRPGGLGRGEAPVVSFLTRGIPFVTPIYPGPSSLWVPIGSQELNSFVFYWLFPGLLTLPRQGASPPPNLTLPQSSSSNFPSCPGDQLLPTNTVDCSALSPLSCV